MPESINTIGVCPQAKISPLVFDRTTGRPHSPSCMDHSAILRRLKDEKGLDQAFLAARLSTTQQSVSRWMRRERVPSGPAKKLIEDLAEEHGLITARPPRGGAFRVPIMGRIGAGGEISPAEEQVPPDGFGQIELEQQEPDAIALEVVGDSMFPRYDPGDIVVVHRGIKRIADDLIGQEVAVKTRDGKRYLKRLRRGRLPRTFNLESFNASPIESVRLEWVSQIIRIVRGATVKRIGK